MVNINENIENLTVEIKSDATDTPITLGMIELSRCYRIYSIYCEMEYIQDLLRDGIPGYDTETNEWTYIYADLSAEKLYEVAAEIRRTKDNFDYCGFFDIEDTLVDILDDLDCPYEKRQR